jgi:glycosyltransferase involved in cell wall biosynthesis
VLALKNEGPLSNQLNELDVPCMHLEMTSVLPRPLHLYRMAGFLRRLQPDLIQGWMVHGNLAALLLRFLLPARPPVLWNIRHSVTGFPLSSTSGFLIRQSARLSSHTAHIIYNSQRSACEHELLGYDRRRTIVIPNGFECDRFKPDPAARAEIRSELRVEEDTPLIGLIARYDPLKDHATFLQAAQILSSRYPGVRYVLAGRGVARENLALMRRVQALGLGDRVHLLGERTDVPRLTASLDIATSCSRSEAFSNTLGEAMACTVPCVATDVGDSAFLVKDTGRVVMPGSPDQLAVAWEELLRLSPLERRQLGEAGRLRIQSTFSIDKVAMQYLRLHSSVAEAVEAQTD